jgi:TPR repeat protein
MRKTLSSLVIALLLAWPGAVNAGDFQTGVTAHQAGDYATALRDFRTAADQGDAAAQYNLGLMYADRRGVAQDYVITHM